MFVPPVLLIVTLKGLSRLRCMGARQRRRILETRSWLIVLVRFFRWDKCANVSIELIEQNKSSCGHPLINLTLQKHPPRSRLSQSDLTSTPINTHQHPFPNSIANTSTPHNPQSNTHPLKCVLDLLDTHNHTHLLARAFQHSTTTNTETNVANICTLTSKSKNKKFS